MKKLWKMYTVFFSMGICCFGGGYAMLSLLQKVIVEKHHWATEEELMDYYAIGQCTPGIIAINTSTFIGVKYAGIPGAIAAALGFLTPSIVIIVTIAAFLTNFAELPVVIHAFAGIRVCVCVLIFDAVWKLGKKALADYKAVILYLVVLALALFTDLSTVLLVVSAGVVGYLMYVIGRAKA